MRSGARGARRAWHAGALAALGAVPALAAQDTAPAQPWPPGFAVFAMLGEGAPADDEALARLAGAGVRGVVLAPDQDAAPAARAGLVVCRRSLVGPGVLSVEAAEFERLRAGYAEHRTTDWLRRPNCLSDPAVQGELLVGVLAAVRDSGPPPCAWVLADRPSTTVRSEALDFSFSAAALDGFRTFLRGRYADAAALDRAWETSFGDFVRVEPFTADRMIARARNAGELPRSLAPWAEHRAYTDQTFARTITALLASVHARSAAPCGLTGISAPGAYGGAVYADLLPHLGLFEVGDAGGARTLAMSFARPGARQLVALPRPAPRGPAQMLVARLADALAHGASGVLVDAGAHPPAALRAALARVAPLAPLAGAALEFDPVWIVESQASVRAHWLLDAARAEGDWLARDADGTSRAARASWVALCEDLGLQPRFVDEAELPDALARRPPRLLVLAACIALGDRAVEAITRFVGSGGHAVADGMLAFYDDRLRLRERPALDACFGLEPRPVPKRADLLVCAGRPAAGARLLTGAAACERGVRGELFERAGPELAVQCEHRLGEGSATYLNLAVCEYEAVRLVPERVQTARDLRRRVQRVLDAAGVLPTVLVAGEGLPTCIERLRLRGAGGRRFLAVRVNALARPDLLATIARRAAPTLELRFPSPISLRVLGEDEVRGPSDRFTLPFDPWSGLFVERIGP